MRLQDVECSLLASSLLHVCSSSEGMETRAYWWRLPALGQELAAEELGWH